MRIILTAILSCFISLALFAQKKGAVTGKIIDESNGDVLIGATVEVPSKGTGAVTDLDGNYSMQLEEGTYKLRISYVGYQDATVEDVKVDANETTIINFGLNSDDQELQEVVVSAKRVDNNEVSLLRLRKKSIAVQDGISLQEINRMGYDNTAESMKSVTGASVEGGKYIVMRGLGDRYSISSMDGVVLPSTNPYRNSVNMDLVPTSMIDNIVVKKTFSPDLPGHFTGGMVDISTRSLPDQFYFNIGASAGYNDQTSFQSNFREDRVEGDLDWLGMDDGSRELPDALRESSLANVRDGRIARQNIQNNPNNTELINEYNQVGRALSDRHYTPRKTMAPMNTGFKFSTGNRYEMGDSEIGFNIGFNYDRRFEHFDNRQINNYTANISFEDRMDLFQENTGVESNSKVNLGGIASLAFKLNDKHEFTGMYMYNHKSNSKVLDMLGTYPGAISGPHQFLNRTFSYQERSLDNLQITGEHNIPSLGGTTVEWSANYITTRQYEPDTRFLGSVITGGEYAFDNAEFPLPFHFFRDLNDEQINGKLDIEKPLTVFSDKDKIKFGGLVRHKERNFTEQRYQLQLPNMNIVSEDYLPLGGTDGGDFMDFFAPSNFGYLGQNQDGTAGFGNFWTDQTLPENSYTGSEQVIAGYLMGVFQLTDRLRAVAGARAEKTDYEVDAGSEDGSGSIDDFDVLPSINLTYSLSDKTNLRFAASRTVARPNMRELAPFVAFDLLGGFPVIGDPNLKQSKITNLDLRYEIFPDAGELFAASLFYKNFQDPIVKELDARSDQPQYKYINTDQGFLAGIELEIRKELDFIDPALENLKIGANFSYIYSRVDMSDQEYNIRRQIDPSLKDWRPFNAQSPYLANLNLTYDDKESGWEISLFSNMFGPRLYANGAGAAPDTYEIYGKITDRENDRIESDFPTPDLGFRIGKRFKSGFSAALSINNILDYSIVRYQEHDGVYYTNEVINPGRSFSLSFNYALR